MAPQHYQSYRTCRTYLPYVRTISLKKQRSHGYDTRGFLEINNLLRMLRPWACRFSRC